ncbi:MAG: NAD(P)-dependent alcohol dehydrogenase [Mycobacterium sp.]
MPVPTALHSGRVALLEALDAPLSIVEVEFGPLRADEVLIRVAGVGVCHTDLSAIHGAVPLPLPAVLGHEASGVVEEIGPSVTTLAPGDHVVISFESCRDCRQCDSGHPAYCARFAALNYRGRRKDGSTTMSRSGDPVHGNWFGQSSFGTHAVASARNAVKVDATLPLALLGPLGCSLQTGAGAVLNVLRPNAGDSIAVFGLGAVGLSAVMAALAAGCTTIVAVDMNAERLAMAAELGATHLINPKEVDDVVAAVVTASPRGVDHSVDAVGLSSVVQQAVAVLRSPGTCATLGLQGYFNDTVINQGHLLLGRTLTGVIEGDADPQTFIPELLRLWQEGRFPFDRLVRTYPFTEINDALAAAADGSVLKPVIQFDGP